MNAQKALDLIKANGIFGLGDYDGCMCLNFEVCGVHVDVSCRKSSGSSLFGGFHGTTVRVYSRHMDAGADDLKIVAAEVIRQVRESEGHLPIQLRFCEYSDDSDSKCAYCGKPRATAQGYLCQECVSKESPMMGKIADSYAFDVLAADLISDALRVDGQPAPQK